MYKRQDHIYVSASIIDDVLAYSVVDNIPNLSDHLPVTCDINILKHQRGDIRYKSNTKKHVKYVRRWDKADLDLFYSKSGEYLQHVIIPHELLYEKCDLFKCVHWSYINEYYEAIVCAINNAVDDCVPLLCPGSLKSFWATELQELKQASIDAYKLWKLCDRRRDGLVNRLWLESKYKYKLAIKHAEFQCDLEFDDELSNYYVRKDTNNFWKAWNHRFSRRSVAPSNINGCCKDDEIVELFRRSFSDVQFDSYVKSNQVEDCLQNLKSLSAAESTENFNECDVLFD